MPAKKSPSKRVSKKKSAKKASSKKASSKKTTSKEKLAKKKFPQKERLQPAGVPFGQDEIEFFYIKGPDFRSLHIDGAIGGITPRGALHIAFFSERAAIPQKTVNELIGGQLGDEVRAKREGKEGVVRQMEVDIFLTESAALDLRNWLNTKLDEFEARRAFAASQQEVSH